MKITIDKNFTYVGEVPAVKQRIKEFKSRYTENDLLQAFIQSMDDDGKSTMLLDAFTPTFLACDIEAWPVAGKNHYFVQMTVRNISGFYEVEFFIDDDLKVSTNDRLRTIMKFQKVDRLTV